MAEEVDFQAIEDYEGIFSNTLLIKSYLLKKVVAPYLFLAFFLFLFLDVKVVHISFLIIFIGSIFVASKNYHFCWIKHLELLEHHEWEYVIKLNELLEVYGMNSLIEGRWELLINEFEY